MARPKKSDAIDIPEQAITHVNTLLQNGQSSFSLNTIAKKIGCSAPALYAYFEGKDDLLEHVRRRAFLNLLAQKQQQYNNQAAPDPVQNLRNGGRYFIAFAQETPHLYQLIFMPKHQCKDSDINIIKTLLQPLIDGIHAAQPHALKQGIKADALAYLMWNSVQGAILMAMKNDTSFQWEQAYEVVETVMTLLFPTSSQQDHHMKTLRFYIFTFIGLCASFVALICYADYSLSRTIQTFEHDVIAAARTFPLPTPEHMQRLPLPVQRYFTFTFPNGFPETKQYAIYKMEGMFRRPLTQKFEPTLARQVASLSLPDMVFSATTPIFGPIWATVYDRFMNGEMEMVAKLLSIFSVVHEDRNTHLNQISLRRWLLESPTFPIALLPGPVVSWHPIDDNHALAVAKAHGIKAELIATFGPNGELLSFDATQGGDLNTPYHGSGERVSRSDYQKIENMRIPMTFEISRIGKNGIVQPFWRGRIQDITFAP